MNINGKIGLVLLPGGGMSSWVWIKMQLFNSIPLIIPKYRLAENTKYLRKTSTISDCVNYIISLIENCALDKVIILAHSGAGVIAANLAKAIPQKILHVIYIAANIPKNGNSTIDSLPFALKFINKISILAQVKKYSTPAAKIERTIRKMFCNTCSEEDIKYVLNQSILSEPLCLAFEKNNWDEFPNVAQTYIILTKDKTISVANQKNMMEHLLIKKHIEIESDHMVMLSHHIELEKVLNLIISEYISEI